VDNRLLGRWRSRVDAHCDTFRAVPSDLLPNVVNQVTGKNEAVAEARAGRIRIDKAHIAHMFGDTDDTRRLGLPPIAGVCSSKLYDAYA
jgi:hypothetical protein